MSFVASGVRFPCWTVLSSGWCFSTFFGEASFLFFLPLTLFLLRKIITCRILFYLRLDKNPFPRTVIFSSLDIFTSRWVSQGERHYRHELIRFNLLFSHLPRVVNVSQILTLTISLLLFSSLMTMTLTPLAVRRIRWWIPRCTLYASCSLTMIVMMIFTLIIIIIIIIVYFYDYFIIITHSISLLIVRYSLFTSLFFQDCNNIVKSALFFEFARKSMTWLTRLIPLSFLYSWKVRLWKY